MNIYFTEMSFKRKVAMDRVSGVSSSLLKHIFILMLFPKAREVNHWLSEIDTFLSDIFITYNNIKGKENISKKDYVKLLIEEPLVSSDQYGYLKKWIGNTIRKENNLVPAFYHTNLSTGDLDSIFEGIKALLLETIEKGMTDEPVSGSEFKEFMKKYIWNLPIYKRK